MTERPLRLVLALCACACACAARPARAGAPDWVSAAPVADGLRLFPDADVVELSSATEITVDERGRRVVVTRCVYHVRHGDGSGVSTYAINDGYWNTVRSLVAWRVDADGRVTAVKRSETLASPQALYSEDKVRTCAVPGVGPGCLVAFECTYDDDLREFGSWHARAWGDVPRVAGSVALRAPAGWPTEAYWLVSERDSIVPLAGEAAGPSTTRWRWKGASVPRATRSTGEYVVEYPAPWIVVRYHDPAGAVVTRTSWRSVSDWYAAYTRSALEDQTGLADALREMDAGAGHSEAGIASRVQRAIGYVQIYRKDGGWRPHPVSEVYRNRFGDCKDMATLAVALLTRAGIEARTVSANVGDAPVHPSLPAPSFNHCIVAVGSPADPAALTYFDPTDKDVPYGTLPSVLQGTWALIDDPAHGESLVRLPSSDAKENGLRVHAAVDLHADLTASAHVEEIYRGDAAAWRRAQLRAMEPVERTRRLAREVVGATGVSVSGIVLDDLAAVADTFRLRYDLSIASCAVRAGSSVFLQPDLLTARVQRLFPETAPGAMIDMGVPRQSETVVEWSLPEGWRVAEPLAAVRFENAFGLYARDVEPFDVGRIVCRRSVTTRRGRLLAEDLGRARDWDGAVTKGDRARLVLQPE